MVHFNNTVFTITAQPVDMVIFALNGQSEGTGGADHGGCTFATGGAIEVDAAFGNPARVSALFEAELSECAMQGSLCGLSTGEARSRWCTAVVSLNALADFATAPRWVQDGMPNCVDRTDPSDQHPDSTGCGVAFLSWLLSQQHSLAQAAQAMVALGDSGTRTPDRSARGPGLAGVQRRDPGPAGTDQQRRRLQRSPQHRAAHPPHPASATKPALHRSGPGARR